MASTILGRSAWTQSWLVPNGDPSPHPIAPPEILDRPAICWPCQVRWTAAMPSPITLIQIRVPCLLSGWQRRC